MQDVGTNIIANIIMCFTKVLSLSFLYFIAYNKRYFRSMFCVTKTNKKLIKYKMFNV